MSPRARWLILGFALAGLVFASWSSLIHYRLLTDPTYVSPCDINTTFSCTQAYLSSYGSVRGVPVALGGVLWFALVALLAGLSTPEREKGSSPVGGYIFAAATIGMAVVLYLGLATYRLKTVCLLCMGTYVCVVGIFIVSGSATSMSITRLPSRFFADLRAAVSKPLTLMVVLLYVLGAASVVAFFPKEATRRQDPPPTQDAQAAFADAWSKQPIVDMGIAPGGAKVVVVKFNDYLCPGCKALNDAYKPILDKYAQTMPGMVKFVSKDWPWNSSCNFNVAQTFRGHESACDAAAAVRMAPDAAKATAMADWLFANQQTLIEQNLQGTKGIESIRAKAKELLGVTDFDAQYKAKLPDIRRDAADGGVLKIGCTPTYYVNGVLTTSRDGQCSNLPPDYLDLAIQIELKKAGGK